MNEKIRSTMPKITFALLAINIGLYFIVEYFGSTENLEDMLKFGAVYAPYILEDGEYWRLLSGMFLHFGFRHLANNMVGLYVIGNQVESTMGSIRFLLIYLISGIGANAVSVGFRLMNGNGLTVVSAGASGAVFGIAGGLLALALRKKTGSIPPERAIFMIFMMLYYGFISSGIDNTAHVAGAAIGLILMALL